MQAEKQIALTSEKNAVVKFIVLKAPSLMHPGYEPQLGRTRPEGSF